MSAGHEVDEHMIAPLHGRDEVMEEIMFRPTTFPFAGSAEKQIPDVGACQQQQQGDRGKQSPQLSPNARVDIRFQRREQHARGPRLLLADRPRGIRPEGGFWLEPLLVDPVSGQTRAQMSPAERVRLDHAWEELRSHARRRLLARQSDGD